MAQRGRALTVAPLLILVAVLLETPRCRLSVPRLFGVAIWGTYHDALLQIDRGVPALVISFFRIGSGGLFSRSWERGRLYHCRSGPAGFRSSGDAPWVGGRRIDTILDPIVLSRPFPAPPSERSSYACPSVRTGWPLLVPVGWPRVCILFHSRCARSAIPVRPRSFLWGVFCSRLVVRSLAPTSSCGIHLESNASGAALFGVWEPVHGLALAARLEQGVASWGRRPPRLKIPIRGPTFRLGWSQP